MKIKLWMHVEDLCDGSPGVNFFSSEEKANDYADKCDQRFCDDVMSVELEFDRKGKLVGPKDGFRINPTHDEDEEDFE